MKHKKSFYIKLVLFALLIYLALIPRVTEVLNHNYLFGFDQGRDYLAVRDIVVNHKFTLIGAEIGAGSAGINGIFQGPVHYYFLAVPFLLLNGDPYSGLVLMFIFGISSILISYLLGKALFGEIFGIIAALFIAMCPPLISQSRFVWNSHPATFFILLCFYFYYIFLKNKRLLCLFLASFFAGFIYNFEIADAIPLCTAIFLYTLIICNKKIRKELIALVSGFILAFSLMIFFEIRHHFMALRSVIQYLFHHQSETAIPFAKQFSSVLQSLLYNIKDTFPPQAEIEILLFILLILIPSIYYVKKEKDRILQKFILFLLLLPIVNFFVFFQLKNAVWQYYLLDLNIAYLLLSTYVFYSVFHTRNLAIKITSIAVFVLLLFFGISIGTKTFAYDYQDYGGTAKIKGITQALDFIYHDAHGKPFGLFSFAPPIYTYQYDYTVLWYGQKTYHYLPTKSKNKVFYLLIEKDPQKTWSYKGWMETVIKTGKVVWTKTLPSGFIIQKRVGESS